MSFAAPCSAVTTSERPTLVEQHRAPGATAAGFDDDVTPRLGEVLSGSSVGAESNKNSFVVIKGADKEAL